MKRNEMRSEDTQYVTCVINCEKLFSIKRGVLANAYTDVTSRGCRQQRNISDTTTQHSSGFISTEVTGVLHHPAAVIIR